MLLGKKVFVNGMKLKCGGHFYLICLTKLGKCNNLELLGFHYFEGVTMYKGGSKSIFYIIAVIHVFLMIGCFNKGSDGKKLYFEPPGRLIRDYTGMVEEEQVNWAWLKLGVRLRSYPNIAIKPFKDFTSMDNYNVSEKLYQELVAWFKKNDLIISDNGELICEGAIVDLKLERFFFEDINPFYEKVDDLFLEIELVMKEKNTGDTVCKISHGAVGSEANVIVEQVKADLIKYFDAHK